MKKIIKKFKDWKKDKDEGYIHDEIFTFVEEELSRGELLELLEKLEAITWMHKIVK